MFVSIDRRKEELDPTGNCLNSSKDSLPPSLMTSQALTFGA